MITLISFFRSLETTHCLRKSKTFKKMEKNASFESFTPEQEEESRKKYENLKSKNQQKNYAKEVGTKGKLYLTYCSFLGRQNRHTFL